MPAVDWDQFTTVDHPGEPGAPEPVDWASFTPVDFITAQEELAPKPPEQSSLAPMRPAFVPGFVTPGPEQLLGATPLPPPIQPPTFGLPGPQPSIPEQFRQQQQQAEITRVMTTPPVNLFPEVTAQVEYEKAHPLPGTMGAVDRIVTGTAEGVTDAINSAFTPENLELMGVSAAVGLPSRIAARIVSGAWATYMGKQLSVDLAQQLGEEFGKPPEQRDTEKIAKLIAEGSAQGLVAVGAGLGALGPGREGYAGSLQEAAEVHGAMRPQPRQGAGQMPTAGGGAGVRPQAQEVAAGAQVSLTPEGEISIEHEADLNEQIASLEQDPQVTGQRVAGVNPDGTPKMEAVKPDPQKVAMLNNLRQLRDQGTMGETPEPMSEADMRDQAEVNVLARYRGKAAPSRADMAPMVEEEFNRLKAAQDPTSVLNDPTAHAQDLLTKKGLKVEVLEEGAPDQPFSRDLTSMRMRAMGNGRIQISRPGLEEMQRQFPNNWRDVLASAVEEEGIHDQVINSIGASGARDYWNDLTAAEKAIARTIYGRGSRAAVEGFTDSQLGHEVIRRRMQRAMGSTPGEFLETVGLQRWGLKGLQALEDVIRGAREALGTEASRRQIDLLNTAQANVRAAMVHVEANPPESRQQTKEEREFELLRENWLPTLKPWRRELLDREVAEAQGGRNIETNFLDSPGARDVERAKRYYELASKLYGRDQWAPPESANAPRDPKEIGKSLGIVFNGEMPGFGNLAGKWLFTAKTGSTFAVDIGAPFEAVARRAAIKDFMMKNDLIDEAEAVRLMDQEAPLSPGRRKKPKDESQYQQKMFLPSELKKEYEGGPKMVGQKLQPERPSAGEVYGKLVTEGWPEPLAAEVDGLATKHLSVPTPNFEDFAAEAKRQFGFLMTKDKLVNIWEDQMWRKLTTASPEELASMIKGFGLEAKIGMRAREGRPKGAQPSEEELKLAGAVAPTGAKVSGATIEDIAARIPGPGMGAAKEVLGPTPKGEAVMEATLAKRKAQAQLLRDEARRWEQAQQDLLLDQFQKAKLQQKANGLRAKADAIEAGAPLRGEKSKPKVEEEEMAAKRRNTRSLAITAIAQKIMGTMEPDLVSLDRREVGHEDIDFENENTVEGPIVEITREQAEHPPTLGKILTEGARRSSRDPVSNTKRVGVFVNKNTGVVDVLSTYEHGRSGPMVYRPSAPGVKGGYRKISELPPTMRAVYAMLLKDPVRDFHMRFDSLDEFNKHFRMPEALEKARAFDYRMYVGEEAPRKNARPMTAEGEEAAYEGTPVEGTEGIQEGGMVQGPEAGAVRGELGLGRGALEKGKGRAMTGSEANTLLEFLRQQEVAEPGDLEAAIDIIRDTAKRKGLRGNHWVVINALDKALAATERANPDLTPAQVYEKTLNDVFQTHVNNALEGAPETSRALFVREAMDRYGQEPGPGPAAAPAPVIPTPGRVQGVARELTMRSRVPPTVVRGAPPGVPRPMTEARPGAVTPPAQLSPEAAALTKAQAARTFPYEPTVARETPPIAEGPPGRTLTPGDAERLRLIRQPQIQPGARGARPILSAAERPMTGRGMAERMRYNERLRQMQATSNRIPAPESFNKVKAHVDATTQELRDFFQAYGVRREIKNEEVFAEMDKAENSGHLMARTEGNEIRLASLKDFVAAAKKPWNNLMKMRANERQAKIVREAAVAVLASGKVEAMPHPTLAGKIKMTWMSNRHSIPDLIALADQGIKHAETYIKSADPRDSTIVGPRWKAGAERLKRAAEYAQAHWHDPELRNAVVKIRQVVQDQWQREKAAGIRTARDFNYYPGRYEGDLWNDHSVFFGAWNVLGRNFRRAKTFRNVYEAIASGPYVPKNFDSADVIEHRVNQGMQLINRKLWQDRLKTIIDPDSGEPVAVDPIMQGGRPAPPTAEYQLVPFESGRSQLAVRKGFVRAVKAAAGEGGFKDTPVVSTALRFNQWLKHNGILLYDTFHPARLAQYNKALSGYDSGYKGGWSALEFKEASLPKAVQKGLVSKEAADWATGMVDVNFGKGQKVQMSRSQILRAAIDEKLNVGRLTDALYNEVGRQMPGIKQMNKFVFGKLTRGMMAESVVRNFEKLNAAHPDVPFKTLMRDVVKDVNNFFGNLGRQGSIFQKYPTLRDINTLFFLAPGWVEGLLQKEIRFASRTANLPLHAMGKGYRQGLPPMGALGGGMAKGLAAYFALTQAINLITRGQFTFQNREEGHKLDAFVPTPGGGFWVNPASVFAELSHDVLRLLESKPKTWDAIDQVGRNKLGPWGRMAMVIARQRTDMGEAITTTPGMIRTAAGELVPYPITLTGPGQWALSKVGLASPPRGAAAARQMVASGLGVKTSPVETYSAQVARMANRFVKQENLRGQPVIMTPTEEASYVKLGNAIQNGDAAGAKDMLARLRSNHTMDQIVKAMENRAKRPFTGSQADEDYFLSSLDKNGLSLYTDAQLERQDNLTRFYNFLLSLPVIP